VRSSYYSQQISLGVEQGQGVPRIALVVAALALVPPQRLEGIEVTNHDEPHDPKDQMIDYRPPRTARP